MELKTQRRLAADVMKCSPKKVHFEESKLTEIKEAITKVDLRTLINQGLITRKPDISNSRARAKKTHLQKVKGMQKGHGSRKGTAKSRTPTKDVWMNKVRGQRKLIRELKEKELVTKSTFRNLYLKVKGGFFRNKRHIKLYLGEKELIQAKKTKK